MTEECNATQQACISDRDICNMFTENNIPGREVHIEYHFCL